MAAPRVMVLGLRTAPFVTIALLTVWTSLDVVAVPEPRLVQALSALLAIGTVGLAFANVPGWAWTQPGALVFLGLSYFGAHVIVLGVDPVAALAFVTLSFVHVEVRSIAERFSPIYERPLGSEERRLANAALGRVAVRLGLAGGLAILLPIFAANLAIAGILPVRTIPSAVILAAAAVVVVALLALIPIMERRGT